MNAPNTHKSALDSGDRNFVEGTRSGERAAIKVTRKRLATLTGPGFLSENASEGNLPTTYLRAVFPLKRQLPRKRQPTIHLAKKEAASLFTPDVGMSAASSTEAQIISPPTGWHVSSIWRSLFRKDLEPALRFQTADTSKAEVLEDKRDLEDIMTEFTRERVISPLVKEEGEFYAARATLARQFDLLTQLIPSIKPPKNLVQIVRILKRGVPSTAVNFKKNAKVTYKSDIHEVRNSLDTFYDLCRQWLEGVDSNPTIDTANIGEIRWKLTIIMEQFAKLECIVGKKEKRVPTRFSTAPAKLQDEWKDFIGPLDKRVQQLKPPHPAPVKKSIFSGWRGKLMAGVMGIFGALSGTNHTTQTTNKAESPVTHTTLTTTSAPRSVNSAEVKKELSSVGSVRAGLSEANKNHASVERGLIHAFQGDAGKRMLENIYRGSQLDDGQYNYLTGTLASRIQVAIDRLGTTTARNFHTRTNQENIILTDKGRTAYGQRSFEVSMNERTVTVVIDLPLMASHIPAQSLRLLSAESAPLRYPTTNSTVITYATHHQQEVGGGIVRVQQDIATPRFHNAVDTVIKVPGALPQAIGKPSQPVKVTEEDFVQLAKADRNDSSLPSAATPSTLALELEKLAEHDRQNTES